MEIWSQLIIYIIFIIISIIFIVIIIWLELYSPI